MLELARGQEAKVSRYTGKDRESVQAAPPEPEALVTPEFDKEEEERAASDCRTSS